MSEEEILQGIDDLKHSGGLTDYGIKRINGLLDLYNKEKEKREIAEENHKCLILDNAQAFKDLGLPEDTIVAGELVLEINKKYISKDKIREKIKEVKQLENASIADILECEKELCIDVLEKLLEKE